MGIIKEPKGVDLIVAPSVLTEEDKKLISEVIDNYKKTGKKPSRKSVSTLQSKSRSQRRRSEVARVLCVMRRHFSQQTVYEIINTYTT